MIKQQNAVDQKTKVQAARSQPPALKLMEGRERAPKFRDTTELPDGSKLEKFWSNCKCARRCGRPPYDRLLTNPVLRDDYRTHRAAQQQGNTLGEGRRVQRIPPCGYPLRLRCGKK